MLLLLLILPPSSVCRHSRPALFDTFDAASISKFTGGCLEIPQNMTQHRATPASSATAPPRGPRSAIVTPSSTHSRGPKSSWHTHGHTAVGDSLREVAREELVGESSAQGRSRNRPRHRNRHYKHRVLTSSIPVDSCAGPSAGHAPVSHCSTGTTQDPSVSSVPAAPTPIPPVQAPSVGPSKTPSTLGTSGASAQHQI